MKSIHGWVVYLGVALQIILLPTENMAEKSPPTGGREPGPFTTTGRTAVTTEAEAALPGVAKPISKMASVELHAYIATLLFGHPRELAGYLAALETLVTNNDDTVALGNAEYFLTSALKASKASPQAIQAATKQIIKDLQEPGNQHAQKSILNVLNGRENPLSEWMCFSFGAPEPTSRPIYYQVQEYVMVVGACLTKLLTTQLTGIKEATLAALSKPSNNTTPLEIIDKRGNNNTFLHLAASFNKFDLFEALFALNDNKLNTIIAKVIQKKNVNGDTVMHAAMPSCFETCIVLLQYQDNNISNAVNQALLQTNNNHQNCFQITTAHGQSILHKSASSSIAAHPYGVYIFTELLNRPALQPALGEAFLIVNAYKQKPLQVWTHDGGGTKQTLLHFAAEKSTRSVAEPDDVAANERTAAHNALFKAFIDNGDLNIRPEFFAALKQKDSKSRNCFHIAAASGNYTLFEWFLSSEDRAIKEIFARCLKQGTGRFLFGKTPIDVLTTLGQRELANKLKEFVVTQKNEEKEMERQQKEEEERQQKEAEARAQFDPGTPF